MLKIVTSNRFVKDLELARKRNLDLAPLNEVVEKLAKQKNQRRNIAIIR